MIRDAGIAHLFRPPENKANGDMPTNEYTEYCAEYYAERTVGMSRYYTAKQTNSRIDKVIRIIRIPSVVISADDIAVLADGCRYRIVQTQELRDNDAGEDVFDISLERIGHRDGNS